MICPSPHITEQKYIEIHSRLFNIIYLKYFLKSYSIMIFILYTPKCYKSLAGLKGMFGMECTAGFQGPRVRVTLAFNLNFSLLRDGHKQPTALSPL